MKRYILILTLLTVAGCHPQQQIKEQASVPSQEVVETPQIVAGSKKQENLSEIGHVEEKFINRDRVRRSDSSMDYRNGMALARCGTPCYAPVNQYQNTYYQPPVNTEAYSAIAENGFHASNIDPLSTLSIDVDVASYANMRRFLTENQMPPADAVRIEEMINYFSYKYPEPTGEHPFSITTELSNCPWNSDHRLMLVGLQGKRVSTKNLPPSNLVFLIDVSGSMQPENKLPLLKQSFRLLVDKLREQDRISIVVYAGSAGLALPPTSGNQKDRIIQALDNLYAGGSTAGGAGIQLAYNVAQQNFIRGGINRVILATDGDFNVGVSSDQELIRLIEEKRKSGVFLSVLGFGMGNLKDSKMEQLADKGNGNYAYIDNLLEAKKNLVTQMGGTLHAIAKDVKIQVEFNPAVVREYRLIGYENRLLNKEDFNDDKKDAGELGAGHEVTALYEIVPVGSKSGGSTVDPLKYQKVANWFKHSSVDDELATVKFRYKPINSNTSRRIVQPILDDNDNSDSENIRFASAVAGFGMLLRNSEYKGDLTYGTIVQLAKQAMGEDQMGYRAEFIKLVRTAEAITESNHVSVR